MYEVAGIRAAEQYKFGSAIDYYRKVLDLLRNLPQYFDTRIGVKERLGHALRQQGRLVEGLDVYQAMRRSAELDGNLLSKARAEIALAALYHEQGDDARALAAATEAEQSARLTGAELELARALRRRAEAAGGLGRFAEAVVAATQALDLSRQLDAPRETALTLALLGALRAAAGEQDATSRASDELATLAGVLEEQGATGDAAYALARLGELNLSLGQTGEARATLERALELYRAVGEQSGTAETLRLVGLAACREEDVRAAGFMEEATALAEATGNRFLRLSCRLAMGEALLAQGQYPAAEALLRQVIAVAEDKKRFGNWVELPHAYDLLVEVLNRQGRGDEARLVETRLRI
jgi:tetratricopeptide (TPR) repeat protein